MFMEEMKCILVLLRSAIKGEELNNNVLSYFDSKEEFESYKSNLFTLISINDIMKTFNSNPSFSLASFLKNGVIPGLYDQETRVPEVGYINNERSFYGHFLKALKNKDYTFDSSNYLNIYNDDLVATIPQVWLYRLGQAMKKDKYERVYFYNKKQPERLRNKEDLIEYLRRTKTFMVEMSSGNKNVQPNLLFSTIEAKINFQLKGKAEVKVDEVMSLFKSLTPGECRVRVSKYKVSEEYFLVRRAEQLGTVFYDEPIEVQEKFLNKWMLERQNSKNQVSEETQKFILLSSTKRNDYNEASALDKDMVVPGLFQLYVDMLSALRIDLSNISLSDFKLKEYMNEETQLRKRDFHKSEEQVLSDKAALEEKQEEARNILGEISRLDVMRDFEIISRKRARYVQLLDEIQQLKNNVSSVDRKTPVGDISEIAFDNEKIMSLIHEAAKNGKIYVDKDVLVIELFNKDITVPVFKAEIGIDKMLEFVETMNMTLEEYGAPNNSF